MSPNLYVSTVAYAYNPRTREVETGGSLGLITSLSVLTGEPQRKILFSNKQAGHNV